MVASIVFGIKNMGQILKKGGVGFDPCPVGQISCNDLWRINFTGILV